MTSSARRSVVLTRLLPFLGALLGLLVVVGFAAILLKPRAGRSTTAIGGPFTLTSQDGTPVTQATLDGHPTLVFFGYTHCPDVCPATLAEISSVFKAAGPDDKARALFITVDPQRDTPPVLKDYLQSFDPRITALTGTPEQIRQVEADYKAYAKAIPDKDGTYSMDHTAITYLMDKRGRFVGGFNLDRPARESVAELKQYD